MDSVLNEISSENRQAVQILSQKKMCNTVGCLKYVFRLMNDVTIQSTGCCSWMPKRGL